jgi:hypothetical protein
MKNIEQCLVENKENVIEPRLGPEKKRKELDVTK